MSAIRFDEHEACTLCGHFGAFVFDGDPLCGDCYAQRGACCTNDEPDPPRELPVCSPPAHAAAGAQVGFVTCVPPQMPAPTDHPGETLKLNLNCCYNACRGCSSIKKLRAFRGRYPLDWRSRLQGSARVVYEASLGR